MENQTLLKWLYDPLMVEEYCEAEGERLISGEVLGYLAQELPKEDQQKSVYEFFSEQESFWNQTPKELNQTADKISHQLLTFLQGAANEHAFCGEKVKAQLMRILFAEPTVLLLDEPSNDIDIETLETLEELIYRGTRSSSIFRMMKP